MKKLSIILLATLSISASDIKDQYQYLFMSGCVQDSTEFPLKQSTAYCICQWQAIAKKYSDKQLVTVNNSDEASKVYKEFAQFVTDNIPVCVSTSLRHR